MRTDYPLSVVLFAGTDAAKKAAGIFAEELLLRTRSDSRIAEREEDADIVFREDPAVGRDSFRITSDDDRLVITASGIRGFMYGIGLFLRKTEYTEAGIRLVDDPTGEYAPSKAVRGHQLGYRDTPNTYDAWGLEEYERYYRDLMYFGTNTVEHMPYEKGVSRRNALMRFDELELLAKATDKADEYDLDVSVWYPNAEKDLQDALKNRAEAFSVMKRFDRLFVPGGDPGDLPPSELFERLEKYKELLKKVHPETQNWPSAQQPHGMENWGNEFIEELKKASGFVDGIITGPNHAFDLDTLRRKTPGSCDICFYPDITHNVRCEYPVHFERDDWHYALAAVNSRESANPRPAEYQLLHKLTAPYVIGSVSYSEGVNDDLNKAVWSALDYDPEQPLREIVEDYARLFFYGADTEKVTDALFGLEKNWEGAPETNPSIEATLSLWISLAEETPRLKDNWRYVMHLFRAQCDALARRKILFENGLIRAAGRWIEKEEPDRAREALEHPYPEEITGLRRQISDNAKILFEQIGLQLGTKEYHASGWERGAVLDTIDNPVTDRAWLLNRLSFAETLPENDRAVFMRKILHRSRVEKDEYYYSLALDGFVPLGIDQTPEFYMDFQGDRPNVNNGGLPVCLQKLFDHFVFRAKVGGLTGDCDYELSVTYNNSPDKETRQHKITVNGHTVYEGEQFGGRLCEELSGGVTPEMFTVRSYDIPRTILENGCAFLEITEPHNGFELAEFRFTKKK